MTFCTTPDTDHKAYMRIALDEAKKASLHGEVPVGAVLVHDGKILYQGGNIVETKKDPSGHAEIVAIRTASQILNEKRLPTCDLYITLEPCTMCAGAIAHARIKRVIFAATDEKGGAVTSGVKFFDQPTCHHHPEIIILDDMALEAGQLLKDFFKERRKR